MQGTKKICLITGANSGIGKAAATELATKFDRMILVVRNRVRGERAVQEIFEKSGNNNLDLVVASLSSFESIHNIVNTLNEKYDHLDVLINNAGAFFSKRHTTVDGIEATFNINYLSRFLFTNLLLPLLKKSSSGRIINVAGESHRFGRINFDDLMMDKSYNNMKALKQSKLADVLFTYELSRRLKDSHTTINCLHPGAVATNSIDNNPDISQVIKFLYKTIRPFLKSPEQGAKTIIYLATSTEVQNISGKYFINNEVTDSSTTSYDENLAKRLWEASEQLTGIKTENYLTEQ
ncbi:MAG: SDR family oxidoreductase [Ignavibacteriales bacterium]|nr:MAG: SDR family oxidoreductase [Ignavibacteriales bacterium]